MRCIEIFQYLPVVFHLLKINYNMRCIEIVQKRLKRVMKTDKLQHEMY